MFTRRSFLRAAGAVGASALASTHVSLADVVAASAGVADRTPDEIAQDEAYWRQIQDAYSPDRTLINLNNGHHSPTPRVVQEALKHYLDSENQLPVYYAGLINRNLERVRRALANEFGCDPEEMAITRNASARNSRAPVMYGSGSRPSRRRTASSKRSASSADSTRSG